MYSKEIKFDTYDFDCTIIMVSSPTPFLFTYNDIKSKQTVFKISLYIPLIHHNHIFELFDDVLSLVWAFFELIIKSMA